MKIAQDEIFGPVQSILKFRQVQLCRNIWFFSQTLPYYVLVLFSGITIVPLNVGRDLNEVVRRANASRYGLAAGVITKNLNTANTLMRALRAGSVWINCFDVAGAAIPFGGYKMSGHGREKGIDSLKNYLQVKAVVTPLKNPAWL